LGLVRIFSYTKIVNIKTISEYNENATSNVSYYMMVLPQQSRLRLFSKNK